MLRRAANAGSSLVGPFTCESSAPHACSTAHRQTTPAGLLSTDKPNAAHRRRAMPTQQSCRTAMGTAPCLTLLLARSTQQPTAAPPALVGRNLGLRTACKNLMQLLVGSASSACMQSQLACAGLTQLQPGCALLAVLQIRGACAQPYTALRGMKLVLSLACTSPGPKIQATSPPCCMTATFICSLSRATCRDRGKHETAAWPAAAQGTTRSCRQAASSCRPLTDSASRRSRGQREAASRQPAAAQGATRSRARPETVARQPAAAGGACRDQQAAKPAPAGTLCVSRPGFCQLCSGGRAQLQERRRRAPVSPVCALPRLSL